MSIANANGKRRGKDMDGLCSRANT
jgi:hypothetical protein